MDQELNKTTSSKKNLNSTNGSSTSDRSGLRVERKESQESSKGNGAYRDEESRSGPGSESTGKHERNFMNAGGQWQRPSQGSRNQTRNEDGGSGMLDHAIGYNDESSKNSRRTSDGSLRNRDGNKDENLY